MDESFKPLFSAPTTPFTDLASAAPQIRLSRSQPEPGPEKPAASMASPHTCVKAATPLVTFKREGDRVTQIHIECPCGQIVVLDCEY